MARKKEKKPLDQILRAAQQQINEKPVLIMDIGKDETLRGGTIEEVLYEPIMTAIANDDAVGGSADPYRKVSEETLRNRTDQLFSSFRMLRDDRRVETLSQLRLRLLPRLFELWTEKNVGKRAQINYYNTMRC